MPQYIQTNVTSLFAQSALNRSQGSLQTSLQRLSSGFRINSAKDDAAGLAISTNFTAQINGMMRARANAADGLGMAQTAEGTLDSMTKMLQRMRELAVQSANATNTADNRQALQAELGQLVNEVDRQARATSFNGRKLLDGSLGSVAFQVGANAGQTIEASVGSFLTNQFGLNRVESTAPITSRITTDALVTAKEGNINTAAAPETLSLNGQTFSLGDISAKDAAQLINAKSSSTGVTATAKTDAALTFSATGNYSVQLTGTNASNDKATISFSIGATNTVAGLQSAANAFNNESGKTGITAKIQTMDDGTAQLHLVSETGETIYLTNGAGNTNAGTITAGGTALVAAGAVDVNLAITGGLTLDSSDAFIAGSTKAAAGGFFGGTGIVQSKLSAVSTLSIRDYDAASKAITTIDAALKRINEQRAGLGAIQSRFERTIDDLQSSETNATNARSRIQDTDFAAETANMTKNQILQQAGTAMLAQANQAPQLVLSLLK